MRETSKGRPGGQTEKKIYTRLLRYVHCIICSLYKRNNSFRSIAENNLKTKKNLSPPRQSTLTDSTDILPLANTPEVFGLHPNAEINYYSQATREIWNHLIELQPQTGEFL